MKTAASRPAEGELEISFVNKYAASAVSPEQAGASRTQMLRISTGKVRNRSTWYITPLVTMRPGYRVPPVTRPRGCHVSGQSYQHDLRLGADIRTVVKPVPEAVEAMFHKVFCSPKIEPRID